MNQTSATTRTERRRGGQPTDMAVVVAGVAAARALRPNASIRSLAAQAHVGRQAVRRAILHLEAADRWAYESQSGLRDDQSSREKADDAEDANGAGLVVSASLPRLQAREQSNGNELPIGISKTRRRESDR
jgi:hypothetical protein